MPKRTTQRVIDTRRTDRTTTISGVTLTEPASGVSDHGLLLGLADDDHPQYLLADGSRALTGSLSVASGATIDGVDISAHAADPAAHHAVATAGDGISVTGQQIAVNSTVVRTSRAVTAGAGLTGGGALSADITLALQTPGTLSVSSTNSSAGAHTHALTSSSNPGAAASLLASDSNGYLQLARLGLGKSPTLPLDVNGGAAISGALSAGSASISGSATITGDLAVGTVLQVNTAGTRVGINRAADQQFDLDVAGAIRGQYLVGRHAIQLSSAVGVWHFDGAPPYNLDYTGSSASHLGGGFTESGGVIYRPGKFGKAVQVAESTTNYCPDPSSEGTSAWSAQYNGSGYLTGAQSTDYALYGTRSYKITATAATWTGNYNAPHYQVGGAVTWAPGDSITVSCYVRGTGTWRIVGEDTGQNLRGAQSVTATDQWQRVSVTCINDTGYTYSSFALAVFSETAGTLYIDGVQIEKTPYVTPYCDGSLGPGHSWTGTPHASASTRTAATVTYSLNAKQSNRWTIMCWRKLDAFPGNTSSWSVRWGNSSDGSYQLILAYRNSENGWRWYASIQDAAGVLRSAAIDHTTVGTWTDWHHLAMTVDVKTGIIEAYLDGVRFGTAQIPNASGWYNNAWDTLSLYHSGAASGLIDELVLLDYVADAKLIRAIYESDAPVFVESSVFHWRSPSRVPIWVDEFGLWARGVSGNEILGVYGGDPRNPAGNVTKSWGGITMEENDVVIGRAAQAAVHWDDSAGTLLIGQPSAANMLLSGGALRIRSGSTDKIVLDSSGNASFTGSINVTGGNAATITYVNTTAAGKANTSLDNSAISTLINGNNIRVGSGTKDSNLNGWNIDSGEIVGQAAGVDQVVLSASSGISLLATGTEPDGPDWKTIDWNSAFPASTSNLIAKITSYYDAWNQISVFAYSPSTSRGGRARFGVQANGGFNAGMRATSSYVSGAWSHVLDFYGKATFENNVSVNGYISVADALYVGGTVGYDWSNLTPINNWANYGSPNATFGIKRFGNMVSVKGVVRAGATISANTAINSQLAAEYRPAYDRSFACMGSIGGAKAVVRVVVDANGYIRPQDGFSSGDWLSVEFTYFTGG